MTNRSNLNVFPNLDPTQLTTCFTVLMISKYRTEEHTEMQEAVFRVHGCKPTVLRELPINFPGYFCFSRRPEHPTLGPFPCLTCVARHAHLHGPGFSPNSDTIREIDWQNSAVLGTRSMGGITRKFCLILVDNRIILHFFFIRTAFRSLVPTPGSDCFKCSKTAVCMGQGSIQASTLNEIRPQRPIPLCVAPPLLIFF